MMRLSIYATQCTTLPQSLLRLTMIASLVSGMFISTQATAQITVSPTAHTNKKPHVVVPDRGPPVVQIARPNNAGVSHNQYQTFNVEQQGVILSNNQNNARTQLHREIAGNPNLANSAPAKIILNEVVGNQRSTLNGPIEVAGHKADVVISNPNGISVNGLAMINANRTMLTTGTPVFGGAGTLDTFRVTRGDIAFEGKGMQDPTSSRTDIMARSIRVNAEIWAKELTMVTGNNKVSYQDLTLRQIDGQEKTPVVALDVAELGGMYANKIRLIGTEGGVGVKDYGEVLLTADDFDMSAVGHITSPKKGVHHIVKRDTSDSSDSDDSVPLELVHDIANQLSEIDFPDDNAVSQPSNPTNDHLLASVPLPVYRQPDRSSPQSSQNSSVHAIDLSPLPLVGGPLGLIPSPEQGAPLGIIPAHGDRPMAVVPFRHTQNAQSGHQNSTAVNPHTPPQYGWNVVVSPHTEGAMHAGPSWSVVPVGEAPIVPLGVIPVQDHQGTTRLFLPPKVFGANLTRPSAPGRYPPTAPQPGNAFWNQPGPSGVVPPHLDAQSCSGSMFSCTSGEPIPSDTSSFWHENLDHQLRQQNATENMPPYWQLRDFKKFIAQKISSPYSRWKLNEANNLPELHTQYRSRKVSVFFDPSIRSIDHIVVSPPRPKPITQEPLSPSENDSSTGSPESQIETPPLDQPPPTPGKDSKRPPKHDEL